MATGTLEDTQVQGIASLPPDLAILRMENDSIQALAAARPRDFMQIKRELEDQLAAFPGLAEDAIYRKPVGKDQNTGQQKYANGLSVRTAETLAESYGYNRVRTDITVIDEDTVKIEATFTDYQRGRIWQDGGILSKKYKDRYGKIQRTPDDRFYSVVVKAAASKHVREVILRSINPGLKAWYWNKCEEIAGGLLDDKAIQKIVDQFGKIGVTAEMLEVSVGRPRAAGWTQEDRVNLLGIWNAIKDGETTLYEAFGVGEPPADDSEKKGVTKAEPLKKTAAKKEAKDGDAPPETAELFEHCKNAAQCDEVYGDLVADDPTMQMQYAAARDWKKSQLK